MFPPPLLSVENLSIAAGRGELGIVQDVSFSLEAGEVTAIVGESGSGKTMVSRSILRLLPSGVYWTGGHIRFAGQDLRTLPPRALKRIRGGSIGLVFQEPMTSLNPALTVGRQLEEALQLHTGLDRRERRHRMIEMLERVEIPEPEACLSAYPHEFSGGMRQRIMLASVMLPRPKLLIADEPTTALDAVVQREVMELMVELTRARGTAILLISHDLSMVAHYASQVIVMQEGAVVESGRTEELLMAPRHPYTRRLLDALPRRKAARPPATGTPVVDVENLIIDYPGRKRLFGRRPGKRAVDGVSLVVRPGETVAVVGGSGSGKTTLGKAIVGLAAPTSGQIHFAQAGEASGEARPARQIVFQDPMSSLDPRMRVGQIVGEALRLAHGMTADEKRKRVVATLADVGLGGDFLRRYPHQLSGGQRQRVAIARATVAHPSLVVADEPVSALDMTVQKQILELIAGLQQRYGFACIFISHDLGAVEQVADRILVMNEGRIVEEGTRDQLFDTPSHPYTRKLLSALNVLQPEGEGFCLSRRGHGWQSEESRADDPVMPADDSMRLR